jgi:PAS domain S-box-containing protein
MAAPDEAETQLRSYQQFEGLIAELLSRFVELPAGEVDAAIGTAQQRFCELFGLDLSSLWQWTPGSQRYMRLTHLYRPSGGPLVPERGDAEEMFPWCVRELLAKRPVLLSTLDDLPPEAAIDRETHAFFGVKSTADLPLSTGGGPVLGILSFTSTKATCAWSTDVVRRLQLVAQIFAGALGRKSADEALRESEERLQLAAESAGVGLWRLDLATSAYWLTDQARRHFSFPVGEAVTLDRVLAEVAAEDRGRVLEAVKLARESEEEVIVEYRLRASEGGERWLSSRGRGRHGQSGEPESIMGVTVDVTERKLAEAALRDLSQRLIQAHEEERALLARELHDDLSQRLAVLAIDVGRVELAGPPGPQTETLRAVREGLVGLSEDVHSLAYQLHPSVLEELGLVEALRIECDRFRRQGRADLSVDLDPLAAAVGPEAALCLFRVTQEALRNVERHSNAQAVAVSLRRKDGGTLLTVRDDGAGFEPGIQREHRSLGLASMRERARLAGGQLCIDSVPGEGTAIVAWVPAEEGPR